VAAQDAPKAEVVALRLLQPTEDRELRRALEDDVARLAPAGVEVTLQVDCPAGEIVNVSNVVIRRITDDAGADLGVTAPRERTGSRNQGPAVVLAGGKSVLIRAATAKTPGAGATSLRIEGLLSAQVATGAREGTAVRVPLTVGQEVGLPVGHLTLTGASASGRGGDDVTLTWRSLGGIDGIKTLKFARADGTALAAEVTMQRAGAEPAIQVRFAQPEKEAVVTPVLFEEVKTVKVGLNVEVKVGSAAIR
jgi:hypothetical protein